MASPEYVAEDRGHTTPCWTWQGKLTPDGYACRGSWSNLEHRNVYVAAHGPIPEGHDLDHLCRVHACVNPAHLEVVTHAENCRRGNVATLTHADVREIRTLLASGRMQRKIAEAYGVSESAISDIKTGRRGRWAGVGELAGSC